MSESTQLCKTTRIVINSNNNYNTNHKLNIRLHIVSYVYIYIHRSAVRLRRRDSPNPRILVMLWCRIVINKLFRYHQNRKLSARPASHQPELPLLYTGNKISLSGLEDLGSVYVSLICTQIITIYKDILTLTYMYC